MALSDLLGQVKTDVEAAAGVTAAQVHVGRRYAEQRDVFETLHNDGTRIHAWYCFRAETSEERAGIDGLVIRTHNLVADGYYALLDPETGTTMTTEDAFDTIIDAVCTQLRNDPTLGGFAQQVGLPQVEVSEWRQIGGYLCHRAQISVLAEERIIAT